MTTKKKGGAKAEDAAAPGDSGRGGSKSGKGSESKPVDPRAAVEPTASVLTATLANLSEILADLDRPAEPQALDLVSAAMHHVLGAMVPCRTAEIAIDRLDKEYVDRNELRVTEAFETAELLADLGIPDLFERCKVIQQMVSQIYNDQNRVDLASLRSLSITERKGMFQRLPAIPPATVAYLNQLLTFEEILLAPRSASRAQVRLGLEGAAADEFVQKARDLVQPFGHLPLLIGKPSADPAKRPLCPCCLLARIHPGKRASS
ncbi:MAG: hypothetical protein AB7I19_16640 [Planctomycetota bacterium]